MNWISVKDRLPEEIQEIERQADEEVQDLKYFISERQAAKILGVYAPTLKVWAMKGKLEYSVHPVTKKRRYNLEMIVKLSHEIKGMK